MSSEASDKPGVILAVDYGLKRVGLAVCDPQRRVAVGVGCLSGLNSRDLARAVKSAARERGAGVVLIGEPPTEARNGFEVASGADKLAQALAKDGLAIVRRDEAFTTARVLTDRKRIGGRGGKRKGWEDVGAAVVLLQEYLDEIHRGGC